MIQELSFKNNNKKIGLCKNNKKIMIPKILREMRNYNMLNKHKN